MNGRTMVSSLFFPASFFPFFRSPCLEQLKGQQTGHADERDLRHNCRVVVVIFAKKEVMVLCGRRHICVRPKRSGAYKGRRILFNLLFYM